MATMRGGRWVTAGLSMLRVYQMCMTTSMALIQTQLEHVPKKHVPKDDAVDFDTTAFFQYVRETPEPSMLVYNRIPKTGSETINDIFRDGALSCPLQLKLLSLNETYWFTDLKTHEERVNAEVRGSLGDVAHGVVAGHFPFPREPDTLLAQWDTRRIEFINTVRTCASRMRSTLLYSIFDSGDSRKRNESNTQAAFVEDLFGKRIDPIQCLQDNACIDKFLHRVSQVYGQNFDTLYTNGTAYFLGGDRLKEEGYTGAKKAVLERAFAPTSKSVGGYIAVGLLEAHEDSMLLFKCLLPSFFRQSVDVLGNIHSNENDALNPEGLKHPYAKLEARLQDKCSSEDSLYSHIMAIHRLLVSKIKADPSLCRKPPRDFDVCTKT